MGDDNLRWDRGLHDFHSLLSLKEAPPLPRPHAYPYLHIRNKEFPWGDSFAQALLVPVEGPHSPLLFMHSSSYNGRIEVNREPFEGLIAYHSLLILRVSSLEACQGDVDSGTSTVSLMTWWLIHSRAKEDMSGHARTMMVMYRVTSWLKFTIIRAAYKDEHIL